MINTIYNIKAKPFLGEENRYHYLYMITNKVNGKIYIGIHSTVNLDDGYSGSGLLLKQSIKKYGINNFQKEILEFYNTRKELAEREHELVNEAFAESDNTYNLVVGGNPKETWDYRTQLDRMSISASERAKRMWAQPGFHEKMMEILHSEEHRKKQSEITKAIWNREGYRERYSATVNSKEYKEAASKRVKELWNDPEYRKKVSESNKKTWADSEKRQQMREINLGRYVSEETRKRIGEASKGRTHSLETRKRISEKIKGTTAGDKNAMAKPLYKIDANINIIKEFGSRKSAMSTVNFKLNQMIKALKNFSLAPDGYYYIYKEDYDKFISA